MTQSVSEGREISVVLEPVGFQDRDAVSLFKAGVIPFWPDVRRKSLDACFRGALWHRIYPLMDRRLLAAAGERRHRLENARSIIGKSITGTPCPPRDLTAIEYAALSYEWFSSRRYTGKRTSPLPALPDFLVPFDVQHTRGHSREAHRRAGKIKHLVAGTREELDKLYDLLLEEVGSIPPQAFQRLFAAVLNLDVTSASVIVDGLRLRDLWSREPLGTVRRKISPQFNKHGKQTRYPDLLITRSSSLSYDRAIIIAAARSDYPVGEMIQEDWRIEWLALPGSDPLYWDFGKYAAWRAVQSPELMGFPDTGFDERWVDRHDAPVWRAMYGLEDEDRLPVRVKSYSATWFGRMNEP